MSIPVILKPGIVSIYGPGNETGTTGIAAPKGFLFGAIDQVWNGGTYPPYVGDSVMFYTSGIIDKLIYSNWPYLLVDETKIILIEEPI